MSTRTREGVNPHTPLCPKSVSWVGVSLILHCMVATTLLLYKSSWFENNTETIEVVLLPQGPTHTAQQSQPEAIVKPTQAQQPQRAKVAPLIKKRMKTALPAASKPSSAPSTRSSAPPNLDGVSTANNSPQQLSEKQLYVLSLRQTLERHKTYPRRALRLRQSGTVIVSIKVNRDGTIIYRGLESPSPFSSLNQSALQLIGKLKKLPPIPESFNLDQWTLKVPIRYQL